MKTIVVNAFGGPGAGKTTAAWEICAELKKAGILTEYVPEYAKELVYEMNSANEEEAKRAQYMMRGTMESQSVIFAEQKHRLDRLMGQVSVIVTDSPIILSAIYASDKTQEFEDDLVRQFYNYNSFNFIIERGDDEYQNAGRIETQDVASQKDNEIQSLLDKFGIPYEKYTRKTLKNLVTKVKELSRAFEKAEVEKDLAMLNDDLSGIMLRKTNAEGLVDTLEKQAKATTQEIEDIKEKDYEL